jgi:hypothetical protein
VRGVTVELTELLVSLRASLGVVWFTLVGLTGCTLWTLAGTPVARRVIADRRAAWTRTAAALTVGFAFAWVVLNKRLEGPVLLPISAGHGITLSDLASVVAVAVAGRVLLWP